MIFVAAIALLQNYLVFLLLGNVRANQVVGVHLFFIIDRYDTVRGVEGTFEDGRLGLNFERFGAAVRTAIVVPFGMRGT